jgi:hypothetical protein
VVAVRWQRDEIPMIVELEKHFSFRQVNETIYEISYRGDPAARTIRILSGCCRRIGRKIRRSVSLQSRNHGLRG